MSRERIAPLTLEGVRFGYPTYSDFLGPITMSVGHGECWAVVGPNGAGKSTLLRVMAGLARANSGSVRLSGQPLHAVPARARARQVAFVPQHLQHDLDISARQIALMGRFPHRSMGLFESAEDHRIAQQALERTGTSGLADRPISTLSGGEAQRVHIAAALAQTPDLLLLDEPTASLDVEHQLAIFRLLRDRARGDGLAVVVVTHDVNLAAHYCTHVLVLHHGRAAAVGGAAETLMPEILELVYGVKMMSLPIPGRADKRWIIPLEETGGEDG